MTEQPTRIFLFALVAITALGPLAMQIFLPALPIIQQDFAVSTATAQLVLSLSMVSIAVSTLAYGPLSDRFGRRPVLIGGLLIFLAGSLLSALADSIGVLILGRIIQAAGGTSGMVLARAIVRDVYAHEKVASVIAYLTVAMVIAPMLAPALGGLLTESIGWRANFTFVGLAGLLVLALVILRLAETNSRPATHAGVVGMLEGFALLLRSPAFCGYAFNGAFALSAFFAFVSAAPYLMVDVLGRPVTEYGLYFIGISLSFMAGNFVSARISERIGIDRMILLGSGIAVLAVAVGASLALGGIWSPWTLFGPTAVIVFGNGLTMANAQAGALGIYPRSAGTASGLSGFLQMAIASVFAQTVGSVLNESPAVMFGFMALALVLAFGAFVVALRFRRGVAPVMPE